MYRICVTAAIKYPKFNKLEIPAFSEVMTGYTVSNSEFPIK
jgi:hypothetical protein